MTHTGVLLMNAAVIGAQSEYLTCSRPNHTTAFNFQVSRTQLRGHSDGSGSSTTPAQVEQEGIIKVGTTLVI